VKLYLSGPMTGIPDYNRPAFEQAAFDLRSRGFEVVSPIELDHNAGTSHDSETGFDFTHEEWEQFLERDYEALQGCAAICLINGWEKLCCPTGTSASSPPPSGGPRMAERGWNIGERVGYSGVRKLGRLLRRKENIERRVAQLERDFDRADDLEAELRISAEVGRQNRYLARVLRRLES
jgi:hypothetical protein